MYLRYHHLGRRRVHHIPAVLGGPSACYSLVKEGGGLVIRRASGSRRLSKNLSAQHPRSITKQTNLINTTKMAGMVDYKGSVSSIPDTSMEFNSKSIANSSRMATSGCLSRAPARRDSLSGSQPAIYPLLTKYTPEISDEIEALTKQWEVKEESKSALPLMPKLGFT